MAVSSRDIVDALLEKTKEKKLRWEKLSNDSFSADIGMNAAVIEKFLDKFRVILTNSEGVAITRITPSDERKEIYEALYDLARRQALRIDETLVDIKETLEKL